MSTTPHLPNLVAAVEEAIQSVRPGRREELRLKSIGIISKLPLQSKQNLTTEKNKALREMRREQSIVILPIYKGNSTVVLDSGDYDRKVSALLEGDAYTQLVKNPTKQTHAQLSELLAETFKHYPDLRTLYL